MSENILLREAISWDKIALEKLLSTHLQKIYAACYRVCLDEQDAHDITQNVLIKIIKHIQDFWERSSFSTWYYRIAYNESITYLKKQKWHTPLEDIEFSLESDEDIVNEIDSQILEEYVTREIHTLPLIERNIILYFYYDELKIKEIAEILNMNENTIKTKLSRAKKHLHSKFKDHENINPNIL